MSGNHDSICVGPWRQDHSYRDVWRQGQSRTVCCKYYQCDKIHTYIMSQPVLYTVKSAYKEPAYKELPVIIN